MVLVYWSTILVHLTVLAPWCRFFYVGCFYLFWFIRCHMYPKYLNFSVEDAPPLLNFLSSMSLVLGLTFPIVTWNKKQSNYCRMLHEFVGLTQISTPKLDVDFHGHMCSASTWMISDLPEFVKTWLKPAWNLQYTVVFWLDLDYDMIWIKHCKHVFGFWGKNYWNLFASTLIVPFSEGGTNSQSTHYLAKSQHCWKLKILLSDTKFINTCSFIIDSKNISACSKVLVEWFFF